MPQYSGSVALALNIKIEYISPRFHIAFDDNFTTTSTRITNKLPDNWGDPQPEEFQFSIRKQWKTPNDRSEGDHKVNKNSPSDQTEGDNYSFIEKYISPQREQVGAIH